MSLSRFTTLSRCVPANSKACKPQQSSSGFASIPCLPDHSAVLGSKSSWETHYWFKSKTPGGISVLPFSAASTPLLSGDLGCLSRTIPSLPRRCGFRPPASKDVPSSYRFPPMTKKPRWWWRVYLMPFHKTWMYAETACHLHPFLEDFEFLTYPFLGAIGRLPVWYLLAYFFVAYLGVVRRQEWPHFVRFHVVLGMLLEITLQVVETVSHWLPNGLYWGKLGMHFWIAVAFGHVFFVLECIRCALSGMYADVPFVCDAAYIQILNE